MPSRRSLVVFALLVVVGIFGIVWFGVVRPQWFEIDGPSMEPGLRSGDTVMMHGRTFGGLFAAPSASPGDVVALRSPADGFIVVKRVLAVGGQRIEEVGHVVKVDGRPIATGDVPCPEGLDVDSPRCWTESIGGRSWTLVAVEDYDFVYEEQTVPAGHVFVRGDHRDRSNDSLNPMIGFVPESSVMAIAN